MSVLLHIGKSHAAGSLGVECFQPPWDISGELYISSSSFCSPGSIQAHGIMCHKSIQTSYSSGTFLDGVSLSCHSSQYVGRHSSSVSHHKRPCHGFLSWPGAQGSAITNLTLWLFSNLCFAEKGYLPSSVSHSRGDLSVCDKNLSAMLERMEWMLC